MRAMSAKMFLRWRLEELELELRELEDVVLLYILLGFPRPRGIRSVHA